MAAPERWKKSVARLRDVPSLVGARGRLRRAWIAGFLRAPHDLRPRLDPTMPGNTGGFGFAPRGLNLAGACSRRRPTASRGS